MKDRQICFDFTDGSEESFTMGEGTMVLQDFTPYDFRCVENKCTSHDSKLMSHSSFDR